MRVMLTGAGGQLALQWVDFLKTMPDIEYFSLSIDECDITDIPTVENFISRQKPDVVINAAAYTAVDKAEDEGAALNEIVNHKAPSQIAALCKKYDCQFVHYSTDYVFDGKRAEKFWYTEEDVCQPLNAYGLAKRNGEVAILQENEHSLILRLAWLSSIYANNFVKLMYQLARDKKELKVVGDQFGSISCCNDVVRNTWALIHAEAKGIFHLSSSNYCTRFELVKELVDYAGFNCQLTEVDSSAFPAAAERPLNSCLKSDKAAAVDGVNIRTWQDQLHEIVDFLKSQDS